MTYKVVAPLVLAKDPEGRVHYVYEGGEFSWLSDEQAEHFLSEGLVVEVDDEPAAPHGEAEGKPLRAANKAEWVAYAVSQGAVEAEAEELNKQELIDLYGG